MRLAIPILFVLLATAARLHASDLSTLLDGVQNIAVPGSPGPLSLFGPNAFPVIVDDADRPAVVVAAATAGNGRLVAFGHNGYFGEEALSTGDTARLMANLINWAGERTAPGDRVVGLYRCPEVEKALRPFNIRCSVIEGELSTSGVSVLVVPANDIQDGHVPALNAFVRRGGAVITGVPGWGWLSLQPAGTSLARDLAANKLFAPAGIVWADGSIEVKSGQRLLSARRQLPVLLNASLALDALSGSAPLMQEDAALAASTLELAARSVPPGDDLLLPRVRRLVSEHIDKAVVSAKPDAPRPTSLGRLALTFELARLRSLPPTQVKPSPLADHFPGAIAPGSARTRRTIEIDLSIPDWHGTGLYAAPGEVISINLPRQAPANLQVRIGCHSDRLWHHSEWHRPPEIDVVRPLAGGTNRVASAFGGLIYIVVPGGASGRVRITIDNAVEAPRFVLGQTNVDEWNAKIRAAPAPWAELEAPSLVLTVPSEHIRSLEDPESLMNFWQQVLDGAADLYQIPRHRARAERIVSDIQISVGYLHSGYPIMTHLDTAPRMVDLPTLRTRGDWGLFHELGHNHQKGEWTFSGTGEVTCNLLPLYLLETLCNNAPVGDNFLPPIRQKMEQEYIAGGRSFPKWKEDAFLALVMYQQLREEFGWETYKKVFAEYRDLPDSERPQSDEQKHDQWMVRFSRAAGRNLAPFFEHWGIPTSESARQSIANLPPWSGPGK